MKTMVIDPGSKRAGWSVWNDKCLVASGVAECETGPIHKRIGSITDQLKGIANAHEPNEIHIERLNRYTHVYCLWSVGALLYAFTYLDTVDDDISVSSWKSYFGLKQANKGPEVREAYRKHFGSYDGMPDDQIEAVLMAAYYVDYLNKRGNNEIDSSKRKAGSGKDVSNSTAGRVRSRRSKGKGNKVCRSSLPITGSDLRPCKTNKAKNKRP